MLSPAGSSYSEDYWRDRCGMPPRGEGYGVSGLDKGAALLSGVLPGGLAGSDKRGKAPVRRLTSVAAWMVRALVLVVMLPLRLLRTGLGAGLRRAAPVPRSSAALYRPASHYTGTRHRPLSLMQRLRARLTHSLMLKASLSVVLVMWLAGVGMMFVQPAPFGLASGEKLVYAGLAPVLAEPLAAGTGLSPLVAGGDVDAMRFDAMAANLQAANETALVALRGFLLTGSEGFRDEWEVASKRLEASETVIELDSRTWTAGARLMELREIRKAVLALREEHAMLAEIAATPNRFPGLRLYREDTEKTLSAAEGLIEETLRAVLAANWQGAAARVDTLAHMRGHIRDLKASLDVYLPSGARVAPGELARQYAAFRADIPLLLKLRDQVPPADQARVDEVRAMLERADAQLAQVLALKQTPRWDYADFAFREKAMPLSEKISSIIAGWRVTS